jgi:signal transduction histidine kinase
VFQPNTSLRTVVGTIVVAIGGVALVTAAALVLISSDHRHSSAVLRAAVESVRLAEEAAIGLLLHARAGDALARLEIERDLREKLERAAEFATSSHEQEILRTATEELEAYLRATDEARRTEQLERAFGAIEALVATNVRQSQAAYERARAWDRFGDALGIGGAVLLLGSAGWLLWWLRFRAFRPLLALAQTMDRFAAGDAAARVPDDGPTELQEMAHRFNEMAEVLSAHGERQKTFLAAVAHEIRTPLSALRLATSVSLGAGSDQHGRLSLVHRQVARLDRLVSDLLETAHIEAGQLELYRERVDVRAIVESVVSLFASTSESHPVLAQLPQEQVIASCDPGRVEQVLNNLVSNAIKYSPGGGSVSVVLEPRPGAVAVSVADEGVGIPKGEIESIFEPFHRGRALQRQVAGVGLGLYVSRRIVEAHGGRLHVASIEGQGSTFEIVLPR